MENKVIYMESNRVSEAKSIKKVTTYMINGKRFIVTPVFREDGHETFGSILMRLMKSEVSV